MSGWKSSSNIGIAMVQALQQKRQLDSSETSKVLLTSSSSLDCALFPPDRYLYRAFAVRLAIYPARILSRPAPVPRCVPQITYYFLFEPRSALLAFTKMSALVGQTFFELDGLQN